MNIGFGIFCFGDDYYYKGAYDKAQHILNAGYSCYILTENPSYFRNLYDITIIPYYRIYKSYHDKIILPKYILKDCDICILLDADLDIKDYSFLEILKNYNFKEGISYIDILLNHPERKRKVNDLDLCSGEWNEYKCYCEKIYPDFRNLDLIWEYFLIINKNGFNNNFYLFYEKLQIKKESCHLHECKDVHAPGEGISISISAHLSDIQINRDLILYDTLKNKLISISRRFSQKS